MQQTTVTRPVIERQNSVTEFPGKNEAYSSGVSWAAVIGGAVVAASLSLVPASDFLLFPGGPTWALRPV